jgi:hypothetical protein
MMELRVIWANARYEIISLLRSWFFRIFAGGAVAYFIAMNIIMFSGVVPVGRIFTGPPSGVPYANMMMLNVAQTAIIIFMASDFIKRDRKFNTSEVFYIRSMTNGAYVAGKALGIFILFAALDLLILVIVAVIQLLSGQSAINPLTYVLYPVLICFPSFVFMIGLSFLLMQLIRNQAVVVLLLLGYYAAILFYLYDKLYGIFDLITIKIPLIYSDFTGFADLQVILMQRGFYFAIGAVFLLTAIFTFKRLPQSVFLRNFLFVLVMIFTAAAFVLGREYLLSFSQVSELRSHMIAINRHYADHPFITPVDCKIEFEHHGTRLAGQAFYHYVNHAGTTLDTLFFSINPGLRVSEVRAGQRRLQFMQTEHLVAIVRTTPLKTGEMDSLAIRYEGSISNHGSYPEIAEEEQKNDFSIWLYKSPGIHAFLSDNFVLLPPGSLWYPRPGLPPGAGFPGRQNTDFCEYKLDIRTDHNLMAISQGRQEKIAPGQYRFRPEQPLSGISLILGPYQVDSISVEQVEYRLYRLPGHDYYRSYFTGIGDTLGAIIHQGMQSYEVRLGLPYPFKRLSLVEVPVQYHVYHTPWTVTEDVVQPEQVWIQENAASVSGADFNILKKSMDRRLDRANQSLSERETQISMLKTFLNTTFFGEALRGMRFGGPRAEYQPDYNLFGNFYTFVVNLHAAKWPILNAALEAFLYDRVSASQDDRPMWFVEGLTPAEEISQELLKQSLSDYLTTRENKALLPGMIEQKGAFLIKLLQNEVGRENFNHNLANLIGTSRFRSISFDTFTTKIGLPPGFDIEKYLRTWYTGKVLPAYLVDQVNVYKVYDRDRIRTQVLMSLTNTSPTTGLMEVSFQYNRRGMGFGMGAPDEEEPPRIYRLDASATNRIGILLDEEPRALNINFLIAKNLPLVYTRRFDKVELEEHKAPFEGEEILDNYAGQSLPNEIIIDNDSKGFEVFNPPFNSLLKRLIQGSGEEETTTYDRFQFWSPPHQWRLIKNASFYGTYVHSAYYIRAGSGNKYVTWSAEIPTEGIYDIYTYSFSQEEFMRGRGNQQRDTFHDFLYTVQYTGGKETVRFSADSAPEGWNFLGSWYLSKGTATVTLSDESTGRVVIADAIKWIKN